MANHTLDFINVQEIIGTRRQKHKAIFPIVALLVVIAVFWYLKLIGITVTSDTLCDIKVHTHDSSCYSQGELICNTPEHHHSADCFSRSNADVETVYDWKKTLSGVNLSNNVAENLVNVATTQVGYRESTENFEYNALAEKHGYTRYGEWYGSPYREWNAMFVSFCMNQANIKEASQFRSASATAMQALWQEKKIYFPANEYIGARGDVVFFDTDKDQKADRVGIVVSGSKNVLVVIEGNVDGAVKRVAYQNLETVMGYGRTSMLLQAENIEASKNDSNNQTIVTLAESVGYLNRYIPNSAPQPVMYRMARTTTSAAPAGEPLQTMAEEDHDITYSSSLEQFLVDVSIKSQTGVELESGSTVYIGEVYTIAMEFSEINSGDTWSQFRHNADGYLTYQLPSNLSFKLFTEWHKITATTENGTVEDVGEYFIDATGLLRVKFYEDEFGSNFVEKYSNVDFNIEFNTTVASSGAGGSNIEFSDNINIDLKVDGSSGMDVVKTHGEYDTATNTLEYTIRVEATHGIVKDLILDDEIWENHYVLRDTILVTDLAGNPIDPQPLIMNHPQHNQGADEGVRLYGFPDFSAGNGFLITYKSQVYDYMLSGDTVDMWNGVNLYGKSPNGDSPYAYGDDWLRVELERMQKEGKQAVLTDNNGNTVPVIEWEVVIQKGNQALEGTIIIDTLGEGLDYYTGREILIRRYDVWGNRLPDVYMSWDQVTITGNTMTFTLPEGFGFDIIYYTTYEEPAAGESKNFENTVVANINGQGEEASANTEVVGFVPRVTKTASGNDGEYVTFKIEADVPAIIKDVGGFYLTDLSAFWGYPNDAGHLYVENIPQDMVITATTASGQTVTFTPYVAGGPEENTYILYAPAGGNQMHSFNVYFNTSVIDSVSSKWILGEDAKLTISYRLPFTAKTGTEWTGELTGSDTLEDVLLDGYKLANEAYLNYTLNVTGVGSTVYDYTPKITKKSLVHETGVIDYTVVFNNTVPGTNGNQGYITSAINSVWFNDTFDERLEYVPGSLVVTGYSPWQKDLWLAKFKYNGTVDGNVIKVEGKDFLFYEYNEQASASGWNGLVNAENFKQYYDWIDHGGTFVFTYQLKVKDEYLYTTNYAKFELENTAELTWDNNGTSGPVTETAEFYTGLLHKHVNQDDSKLDFEVHINRKALDILDGVDTLIIQDSMSPNLSVYWDSIQLKYEKSPDEWVYFSSPESEYTYTVKYDVPTNTMIFTVPDSLHIIIGYTTLITESGYIAVENSVKIDGKAEIADIIDAFFLVEEHTGGASGSNHKFVLIKQDGISNIPLPNATFLLYGQKGDPAATAPPGAALTVTTENGTVLKYIGSYTTGPDGTVTIETQYLTIGGPYALVEFTPPEGYEVLKKPVFFYFYDQDPNGVMQTVTTLIAIENYSGNYVLPETGGIGTTLYTAVGFACLGIAATLLMYKRKKRRKEDSAPL